MTKKTEKAQNSALAKISKQTPEAFINFGKPEFDPEVVLKEASEEQVKVKGKQTKLKPESKIFKALTLFEFDNGVLMSTVVSEQYKSFVINFSRQLQEEFKCNTPSEKSIAEVVAVNYARVLEIQRRINSYLGMGSITDMGVRYLSVMSKELDRAQRHYLSSLQTLRVFRQPLLEFNLRADTAVVGQNQVIQANKYE